MPEVIDGLDVICAQFVISMWIAVLVIAALAGGFIWRGRRRGHLWLRLGLGAFAVSVMAVVATAASVNAHYAYLPTVGDVAQAATGDRQWVPANELGRLTPETARRAETRGLVIRLPIAADPTDGFAATKSITYLPPQYFTQPSEHFRVLYLFHGSPGQAADWFHAGRAEQDGRRAAASGQPVIIVAPAMSRSWTDDPECVDGATERVESHLFADVIPTVDNQLRTQPNRDGRIFAGMSAGGYCALNLGLRHRDAVATIIDLSGDTGPTHTGGPASLFGPGNPDAAALVAANDPAVYAATLPADPPMRIWLDSGTADTAIAHEIENLDRVLAARQISVVYRTQPGGHTYWVWTAAMNQALPWALDPQPSTS